MCRNIYSFIVLTTVLFPIDLQVSDEKDARGYLQALAQRMSEELEWIKMHGVPVGPPSDKSWRNRRSQRLDKMELLDLQR